MKLLYLILLTFGMQSVAFAGDDLNFKWMEGKSEIGALTVTIEEGKESVKYSYASTMKLNYAEEITVQDILGAEYLRDTLVSVNAKRNFNGRTRVSIQETYSKDAQKRVVRGSEKELNRAADPFSYLLLFVKPPVGESSVYSELYGVDFKVIDNGKNTYTVIGAKNRTHKFTYDDKGNLLKAVINLNVGVYTLVAS